MPLTDGYGRRIEYLRISVTDKCNFRCIYCLPEKGLQWLPRAEILSYEEIAEVVRQLAPLGLSRVRLTGGEPTIRPELHKLVALLAGIPGIEDLSLSTNGLRLRDTAVQLRHAGLRRVNISADSLQMHRVDAIARRRLNFNPLDAAEAAEAAGLTPVKLNVVVLRGINDDEIVDFARLTTERNWCVRFIELMPVGELHDVSDRHVVSGSEIRARIEEQFEVEPFPSSIVGNGPARYFRIAGAPGAIGVITPMTHTYCDTCNRVRLTADGRLRTCLYGTHEVNLRDAIRRGERIDALFRNALADKPLQHYLLERKVGGLRALSEVGG